MFDISVYGHLTIDRVFDNFNEQRTLGAIGNFWEACMLTNPLLNINIQPLSIGEAIIYVNKKTAVRQGRGILNLVTKKLQNPAKATWNHIMYLNQLKDVSFIDNLQDSVVSADLTSGAMNNIEYFEKLDYLFISDEDLFMDIDKLAKMVKGHVILHYPAGSICHNGEDYFEIKTDTVDNLNVLGAGDFFAASFIVNSLKKTSSSLKKRIEDSHQNTKDLLIRRNNEQKN